MSKNKKPIIEFICNDYAVRNYAPVLPASNLQPDSWKHMKGTVEIPGQERIKTAKLCPAIGTWMDLGYILCAPCDIEVSFIETQNVKHLRTFVKYSNPIYKSDGHGAIQIQKLLSDFEYRGIVKIHHPWWIKTLPGYSCLFLPLLYWDQPFQAVPGILDTDLCHMDVPINLTCKKEETFVIKMGTPLVQIVPFKRETITGVSRDSTDADRKRNNSLLSKIWLKFFGIGSYFYRNVKYTLERKDLDA